MIVKLRPCWEYSCRWRAVSALVRKGAREMDVLNVLPQVSAIIASFST